MLPPAWGQVLSITWTWSPSRKTASPKPPISTYLPSPGVSSSSSQRLVQLMSRPERTSLPACGRRRGRLLPGLLRGRLLVARAGLERPSHRVDHVARAAECLRDDEPVHRPADRVEVVDAAAQRVDPFGDGGVVSELVQPDADQRVICGPQPRVDRRLDR